MKDAFENAWENHVQSFWGGWTLFAKLHTKSSADSEKRAFKAGFVSGQQSA